MAKFFPGFLVGVGLGVLLAPMPGQKMRQMLTERIQKLRGNLPENDKLVSLPSQISDRASQASNTLKSAVTQMKGTVSQQAGKVAQTVSKSTRPDKEMSNPAILVHSPLATSSTQIADPIEDTSYLKASLSTIPGMEPEIQSALEAQGIRTPQQLLERTPTKQERTDLAHKVGLNAHRIKTLTDRADFMRLQGVNSDIATMLEEAGVNGCKDLQHRNPEHLHAILTELYEKKQIALPPPELDKLILWVAEAMGVAVTGQE